MARSLPPLDCDPHAALAKEPIAFGTLHRLHGILQRPLIPPDQLEENLGQLDHRHLLAETLESPVAEHELQIFLHRRIFFLGRLSPALRSEGFRVVPIYGLIVEE